MANEPDNVMRCPKCFGRDVRPSRNRGFFDNLMGKFRRKPYRCRSCHSRFYVYIPLEKDEIDDPTDLDENEAAAEHNPDVAKPAE